MDFEASLREVAIKGTVSQDFLLLVFFMNQFFPAPEYPIRIFSNFLENFWRYLQVKVHHRCLATGISDLPLISTTPATNFATGVNDTGCKFATGVNDTGGKKVSIS